MTSSVEMWQAVGRVDQVGLLFVVVNDPITMIRYYDPTELDGIKYLKMPINHNRKDGLPMDRIKKCVAKIKDFRDSFGEEEPKMALIHW